MVVRLLAIIFSLGLASCSAVKTKKSQAASSATPSGSNSNDPTANGKETSQTPVGPGTVGIATDTTFTADVQPDQLFARMDSALGSLSTATTGTVMLDPGYTLLDSDVCSMDNDGLPLRTGIADEGYAGKVFNCLLTFPKKLTTARGSYGLTRGLTCFLAKTNHLVLDGSTQTLDLAPDDCFPSEVADVLFHVSQSVPAKVTGSRLTGSDWTMRLAIALDLDDDATTPAYTLDVYMRATDTAIAFKLQDGTATSDMQTAVAMTLGKDGTLLFEHRIDMLPNRQNANPKNEQVYHSRLLFTGAFKDGQDLAYASVDRIEGIYSAVSEETMTGPVTSSARNGDIYTISGSLADGYKTRIYNLTSCLSDSTGTGTQCHYDTAASLGQWPAGNVDCLANEAGKACGAGLAFDFAASPLAAFKAESVFLMLPEYQSDNIFKQPLAWFAALTTPLAYTSVGKGD